VARGDVENNTNSIQGSPSTSKRGASPRAYPLVFSLEGFFWSSRIKGKSISGVLITQSDGGGLMTDLEGEAHKTEP